MSVISIVKPVPLTKTSSAMANSDFILTPDPKEAALKTAVSGSAQTTVFDFGAPTSINTLFVGFVDAASGNPAGTGIPAVYSATSADPTDGSGVAITIPIAPSNYAGAYPRHFLSTLSTRTMRSIALHPTGAPGRFGTFMAGAAFRPTWGHEYGSGRFIGDTGSATRNFAGGFSIDDGVATTGWQWTLGDLSDDEREALFQLVKDRRTTRSVLVVEDPDLTTGLHERIHWGLFDRLEAYERDRPGNNRWGFRIEDWV